eukprot:TRINITY_DN990_c0_g4_i2.p1 TRINITY_DN990_c0_g4~~TRINITY_DN990_c0_g4_i2.p1  ORF type:complete len:155 (-),score=57.97 TRINITY_DN990_c0_g4_i2:49-513(-)
MAAKMERRTNLFILLVTFSVLAAVTIAQQCNYACEALFHCTSSTPTTLCGAIATALSSSNSSYNFTTLQNNCTTEGNIFITTNWKSPTTAKFGAHIDVRAVASQSVVGIENHLEPGTGTCGSGEAEATILIIGAALPADCSMFENKPRCQGTVF